MASEHGEGIFFMTIQQRLRRSNLIMLIVPVVIAAVLMAFSRLYLYVHFPSDVLAGAVLGVGIGLLAFSGGKKLGFLK